MSKSKSKYRIKKFTDGWWSVIDWNDGLSPLQEGSGPRWGKWRGPFDTKADAEIDCANTTKGRYELP